tara:strand:+ start:883 stop:1413 length:531 start_codon:yes stop_codon:yes gene_type:complete
MIQIKKKDYLTRSIFKVINSILRQSIRFANYVYYRSLKFEELGENVVFSRAVNVFGSKNIQIGENTFVGDYSIITAGRGGKISIGSNCAIAAHSKIINWNHDFRYIEFEKFSSQNLIKDIVIGDNCWLGYGSVIVAGAKIDEGCIVMPNSVVNTTFEKFSIIAGIPAIKIGTRKIK